MRCGGCRTTSLRLVVTPVASPCMVRCVRTRLSQCRLSAMLTVLLHLRSQAVVRPSLRYSARLRPRVFFMLPSRCQVAFDFVACSCSFPNVC